MTYYVKGGSKYNEANPKTWMLLNLAGYDEDKYVDPLWKDIDYNFAGAGEVVDGNDPFYRLGGSGGGDTELILGLWEGHRIKINESGCYKYIGPTENDWQILEAGDVTGETNTGANSGSGTSVYYTKVGVQLRFNAVKSENDRLSVALDSGSHDVELTLNEGNIIHSNLSGGHNLTSDIDHNTIANYVAGRHKLESEMDLVNLGTKSHTSLTDKGSNTHPQIDTHLGLTNEHIDWEGASVGTIHIDNYIEGGAGTDTTAIHDNEDGEINTIEEKVTPVDADVVLIEDSAASYAKKKVLLSNMIPDDSAYDYLWDSNLDAATKNVLYDKIEELLNSSLGLTLFLHQDVSGDVGGYRLLTTEFPDDAKTEVFNVTVTTDNQEIEQWVTPEGVPNLLFLLHGIYQLHFHAYKFSGAKDVRLYFKVYKRASIGGAETLLGTSHESTILTGAEEEFELHVGIHEESLLATDRIVLKIFASLEGVGNNPVIYFYVEGDTLVRFLVPVSVGIRSLDDIGDVTITAPVDNELLAWDSGSSQWINQTAAEAGIVKYTDAEAVSAVEAVGLDLASTKVITSADADLTFTFGRAQIDSRFSDMMTISHRDMSTQDQYAFGQINSGNTYINAPTGKLIYFHINDVEKMSMSVNSLSMSVPIAMGTDKITGLGDPDNAQDAATKAYVDLRDNYIHLQDQKAAGTVGGTFTFGAWRTRTLNTEVIDQPNACTLAANQFELIAGTYRILASAPGNRTNRHKIKLRNITDGADEMIGTSELMQAESWVQSRSFIIGLFTIADTKTFEIQHQCQTTRTTDGFGFASNFGVIEIYTDVQLWKVA